MERQAPRPRIPSHGAAGVALLLSVLALLGGCDALRSDAARLDEARESLAAGDARAAVVQLKDLLDSDPDNGEARLALAEASLLLGDADTADKELRRALDAGVPAERAAELRARIMLGLGQAADLLKLLNDGALAVTPRAWPLLKAEALAALGDMAAAEVQYRAALGQDAASARAAAGLAAAVAAQGRRDEALQSLAAFSKSHPAAAEAWLMNGSLLSGAARFSEAERAFSRAVEPGARGLTMPQRLLALNGLAEAQMARGGVEDAKATLARMRSEADGSVPVRVVAARIALIEQDYAAAVVQLQPVVARLPDYAPARFLLGAALLSQGNFEQAETQLTHLVQLAPDNVEARKLLARARLQLQRFDSAMQVLTPAMQGESVDPELSSLLSAAKLRAGDQGEAIAVLEQSVARNPDNAGVKLDLATAYIAAGRSAAAVELLRQLPEVAGDTRREALLVAALAAARGPDEARREVQRLVTARPKDVNILTLAAGYLLSQSDHGGAREYLQRALAVEPASPRALLALAQTEVRAGSLDAATAALERLVKVPEWTTAGRLALVEVAQLRNRPDEVRRGLEQIRAEDPKATMPRVLLARVLLASGDGATASKVLSEAVAIAPGDATLRVQVARLLAEFNRYEEALAQLREAVDASPRAAEAWVEMARVNLALDRADPAREAATRANSIAPDAVDAVGMLALLDLRERRAESALQRVRALAARRPKDADAAMLEGDVKFSLGQHREAAQAFQRAFELRRTLQTAVKHSAAMRAAGMPNSAAPLARWVGDRPDDAQARTLLAEAYQLSGQREAAIEQYERLAQSSAAGFAVLNNLAWLYHESGDARAEATARRAYELAPDNPAVADTYGWILLTEGQVEQGSAILAKAAAAARDNPDIQYHHAAALARAGKAAEARSVLDAILAPRTPFATRADAERLRRSLAGGAPAAASN